MEAYAEPPFQESPAKPPDIARSAAAESPQSEKPNDAAGNNQNPEDIETIAKESTKVLSELASTIVNDSERLDSISSKVHEMKYVYLSKRRLENEKDKYKIRTHQAMFHIALSDKRLEKIEEDLRELQEVIHGRPISKQGPKRKDFPHFLHELRRSTPSEFRITVEIAAMPASTLPALEVLIADNESIKQLELQNNDMGPDPHINPLNIEAHFTQPSLNIFSSPERLRIRSQTLIHWLGIVTGNESLQNFADYSDGETDGTPSLVILRPFKILVTLEREIRQELKNLKNRCRSVEPNQESYETQEDKYLLEEVSLLNKFLEVDLKPTFQLRQSILEGTATSISYRDLWHLFQVGGMVVSQQDPNQIYRVIKFTVRSPVRHEEKIIDC